MGEELQNCPFCGSPASLIEHSSERDGEPDGLFFARCDPCDLIIDSAWCVSRDACIAAWNTRTQSTRIAELEEALREIIKATHSADERSWIARHVNGIAFNALGASSVLSKGED